MIVLLIFLGLALPQAGCESFMEVMRDNTIATPLAQRPMSTLVYPGDDGKLVYNPMPSGDRIPDFSNCGYMGGGVAIPNVPVRATLEPKSGDDTKRIQAAIDEVSQRTPDRNGFRGAVLLKKGRYHVRGTLRIGASGVVLRGEGDGPDGTIIRAAGTEKRTLITIAGEGTPREVRGSRTRILDEYVPVGARSFRVEDGSKFKVGDAVIVHRPSTEEWIRAIGMHAFEAKPDGSTIEPWKPGTRDLRSDRVITAIRGDEITIDAPLCNSLDQRYGGGTMYKYDFPGRIRQVGVERLRSESDYASEFDEAHAWTFIKFDAVENAWVRFVTTKYYGFGLVAMGRQSKWITVEDSLCLDPKSEIRGDRRYSFQMTGQLLLVQRCYAREGRHDYAMDSISPGPNVFVDCATDNSHADTGPHHRWSVGTLHDNLHIRGHKIRVRNAGNEGTGHGWTGANMVLWNCSAEEIVIERPPTANNWAIGSVALKRKGDGTWDRWWEPVQPRSLYYAQLAERMGDEAVAAVNPRTGPRVPVD